MERSGSFRRFLRGGEDDADRLARSPSDVSRKRSMIRPERQRLTRDDPHYYYSLVSEESNVNIRPSSTGNEPYMANSNSHASGLSNEINEEEEPILEENEGGIVRSASTASRTSNFKNAILGRSASQRHRVSGGPQRQGSHSSRISRRSDHLHLPQRSDSFHTATFNPSASVNDVSGDSMEDISRQAELMDPVERYHGTEHAGYHDEEHEEKQNQVHEPQAADTGPDIPIDTPDVTFQLEHRRSDSGGRSFVEPFDEKSSKPPVTAKKDDFDFWQTYCRVLTFPVTGSMLKWAGMNTPERQMAWREKIGLISCILMCGAFVGFLTFGFTETVCSNTQIRIHAGNVLSDELVISGSVYDLGSYSHPGVEGIDNDSPILYPPVNAGGKDASFLFQNVNGYCKNLITPKKNTSIPHNAAGEMGWYFPCQLLNMNNNSLVDNKDIAKNHTDFYDGWACHSHNNARSALYDRKRSAIVYYTWEDLVNKTDQQLVNINGDVLNLDYLDHLLTDELDYPPLFDTLRHDKSLRGRDISQEMSYGEHRKVVNCLRQIVKVGEIDTEPIGCIASKVVLYVSLVFIMGLVVVKFVVACYFRFVMARHQGAFPISESEFQHRERNIEDWGDDIYTSAANYRDGATQVPEGRPAESTTRSLGTPLTMSSHFGNSSPMVGAQFTRKSDQSKFQPSHQAKQSKRKSLFMDRLTNPHAETSQRISGVTMSTQHPELSSSKVLSGQSLLDQPVYRQSVYSRPGTIYERYGNSNPRLNDIAYHGAEPEEISMDDLAPPSTIGETIDRGSSPFSMISDSVASYSPSGPVGGLSEYIVPQPPLEFQPFGYPLAHVMCMVTAYSESVEGLRTTIDSICTTEYPNSHKLITIVCDGLIKGSGNDMTTPEICLSMMTDFSEPIEDVQPHSYVSVVSGEKRHNMAKVYAGFYKYDDTTVPPERQQRVPVICVVKCGTPREANAAKPGNRGKRDSQVILMSFLQHVMFDERMTELDFEIFNGIRSVTGIAPDYYELMLMVDADTKVFPDCLTHMCAEMVRDPEIMGLCGETKIANKRDTWVTMIQVFEYFISHHQAKGFESVFGSVSCLPGCFSMYRIKSPKGADGYWVPILCNPDIVERYSDNVIDTLHRKNLLLLGEDRFLSTLMAKTFPKRKTIFLPKAACKTIVPDEFKVLLSQRRRWINSTIHNLFELVLVRDSCGVFVISMQFVVLVDLISTLVLPAAIAFTLYVVIIACVKKPTPILSLILLAMILGLPGVLIVVTASRASYLVWMGIYLMALPIWNFVLPMYAYWKFDDFSWGDTRAIAGGDKGHEEADGEFDSSQIVMKKWSEFQRDRAGEVTTNRGNSSHNLLSPAPTESLGHS